MFVAFQPESKSPVKVGANREEAYRRPTTSPVCCRRGGYRCLLAGADYGPDGSFPGLGTWLGVNEAGLVVAVTNRSDGHLRWEEQVNSRGLLAVALLGFADPGDACRYARDELSHGGYGGSDFLIVSPAAGFCIEAPGAAHVVARRLEPGIHAVTNLDLNDPADRRIRLVRNQLDARDFVASAQALCRDDRILVAGPDRGTVSSSQVVVGPAIELHHLRGNPSSGVFDRFLVVDRR